MMYKIMCHWNMQKRWNFKSIFRRKRNHNDRNGVSRYWLRLQWLSQADHCDSWGLSCQDCVSECAPRKPQGASLKEFRGICSKTWYLPSWAACIETLPQSTTHTHTYNNKLDKKARHCLLHVECFCSLGMSWFSYAVTCHCIVVNFNATTSAMKGSVLLRSRKCPFFASKRLKSISIHQSSWCHWPHWPNSPTHSITRLRTL